jgi:hypothetical protein
VSTERQRQAERVPRSRAPKRTKSEDPGRDANALLALQRQAGNAAVSTALAVQRAPAAAVKEKELTGIGAQFAVDQYVGVTKKVREHWTELTPYGRAEVLVSAVNFELAHFDIPQVAFVLKDLGGTNGQLDFGTWTLELNKERFNKATPEAADLPGVARTVYHESRHAEQWFRMARLQAGLKMKAADIEDKLGIPTWVVKEAVKSPLKGDGAEAQEAKTWFESVYGSKADERNKTLTDLEDFGKKYKDALAAQATVEADASASADDKKKAGELVDEWKKKYDEVYVKYRALPEEADAWKLGNKVESAAK